MSKLARKPILQPAGVTFALDGNSLVISKGDVKKEFAIFPEVEVKQDNDKLYFSSADKISGKRYLGTIYSLVSNAVHDLAFSYSQTLVIQGTGFKSSIRNGLLMLSIGFSHDVAIAIPADVKVEIKDPTRIIVSGNNRIRVSAFANYIRSMKKPEPYKGKGISYENEAIRRKQGKKK